MAWVTPRNWNPGETVTASMLNAHVRDNMNVLKTRMSDNGDLRILVKGFGYSSGQGNAAGGGQTQLTSYDVPIGAGLLSQPGDALLVEGVFSLAQNTNAKTAFLQVDSGTQVQILSHAASVALCVATFRFLIKRRSSTTGAGTGVTLVGAGGGSPNANYMQHVSITTVNWGNAQTLKVIAASSGASDVVLSDYSVALVSGVTGALV